MCVPYFYYVVGRRFPVEDFRRFFDRVIAWYAGTISGARFEREVEWFKRKYNLSRSMLYTVAREAIELWRRGELTVYASIRMVLQKFKRYVRKYPKVYVVGAQLCVFTLADYDLLVLEDMMNKLVLEQTSRWGRALEPVDRYVDELMLSEDDFLAFKSYLESFNSVARDSMCWAKYGYTPPPDFNVPDHILSYFEICGIEQDRFVTPNDTVRRYLELEDVCGIVTDYEGEVIDIPSGVVVASLYVFANEDIYPRCQLWKAGGWRPSRTPYGIPLPPPKRPGRPPKQTTLPGISFKPRPKEFSNPLKDFSLDNVPEKFRETLEFCKQYGLNPIPLAPNSKMPIKGYSHSYLALYPIRRSDLQYFFDERYNIGVYAGYGNLVIVDIDVKEKFPIKTACDETRRGYHYYIRTGPEFFDMDIRKVYTVEIEGKPEAILHYKTSGYVVAPRSIVVEDSEPFEYRWISRELVYVDAKTLVNILNDFARRVIEKYGGE